MFGKERTLWKKQEQKIIGFAGVERGTGTTYCMMMMAYFTKQVLKRKTAIIHTGQLSSLCRGKEVFSVKGIDIFKEPKTFPMQYSYLFFDYGTRLEYRQEGFPEFSDCSIKLITASLCPWKQEALFHFVEHWSNIQESKEWIYLIPFASQTVVKTARKQMDRKIYVVNPEQEWHHMGAENLILWKEILQYAI